MIKILCFLIAASMIIFTCNPVNAENKTNPRTRLSFMTADDSDLQDLEAEILFGRDLAARILGNYKTSDDEKMIHYVNLVGKAISLYSGRPELKFYFIPLASDEINAFATPGGYIFITTGALKAMNNEAQLACVLAHEIAHVTEKHVVRRLNIKGDESSAFSALSGAIGGSTAAVKATLEKAMDEASAIFFSKGYTIKEEMGADSTGIMIASLAGYDPVELIVFLESSKGFEKQDASYKGDHPQLSVRVSAVRNTISQLGLDNQTAIKKNNPNKMRSRFYANIKK